MPTPVVLKASEYTVAFKFFGADVGAFPGSTANTSLTGQKLNSLSFEGGEEVADFKAGQEIMSLERIIGQASRMNGQLNFKGGNYFMKKYQDEGPLVEVTLTGANAIDSGTEITFVFQGLMKLPDFAWLENPGKLDFQVGPYGVQPTLTLLNSA